jgi:hypothetical protein
MVTRAGCDARHNVPKRDGDGERETSPIARYKQRCAELDTENARLREQLRHARDDGSLFNLASDTSEAIGKVIVGTVGEAEAAAIARAITPAVKARKVRPSHGG